MSFAYLACLLGGIACMCALDWRFRLFWFADVRRAAIVHAAGFVCFVCWDVAGIVLGVFRRGPSPYLTGVELAPHLTLEELFFLIFLVWCAMVLFTGSARVLGRLRDLRSRRVPRGLRDRDAPGGRDGGPSRDGAARRAGRP